MVNIAVPELLIIVAVLVVVLAVGVGLPLFLRARSRRMSRQAPPQQGFPPPGQYPPHR